MDSIKDIVVNYDDGSCHIKVEYDSLKQSFDSKNRIETLYSKVSYESDLFKWDAVIPTVEIPYKDPALGFLLNDNVFSSVGVYQRAPGVNFGHQKKTKNTSDLESNMISVITEHKNFSIKYMRHGVVIELKRGEKRQAIPIGIFLKAYSELPYGEILKKIAYKPPMLLNSFPCDIQANRADLGTKDTYGITSKREPSIQDCVNFVYSSINSLMKRRSHDGDSDGMSLAYKLKRIRNYVSGMNFKNTQTSELNMSLGGRAIGTRLGQDINLQVFDEETGEPTVYHVGKGTYIDDNLSEEIRKYDIKTLRVVDKRSFVLQDCDALVFRVKGYRLASDFEEYPAGTVINDEILTKLNNTQIYYLNVETPAGVRLIRRSDNSVSLESFLGILNHLFTAPNKDTATSTQYDVSSRIIKTYEMRVMSAVEATYNQICEAIADSQDLSHLLSALPSLPDKGLKKYLRDTKNKEISQAENTNVMSRAINEGKSSALMKETPVDMMWIQQGQWGRIDSLHAPESAKIGSVQQKTVLSKINQATGEIEAPLEIIENGLPTGRIEYVSASRENHKRVLPWDTPLTPDEEEIYPNYRKPDDDSDEVYARCNGDVITIPKERADFREVSPFFDMSISRACIPFPEFSQPKRSLMATKMQGQAVPLLFPERPLVSTGVDTVVPFIYYTARQILETKGIEVKSDNTQLEIISHRWEKRGVTYYMCYGNEQFTFNAPFTPTDKQTLYSFDLNVKPDYMYNLDDIVLYNHSCDLKEYDFWVREKQGKLPLFEDYRKPAAALGVNLRVGYKTFGSSTVDDAVVISSRLVEDMTLSSIQIVKYRYDLKPNEDIIQGGACAPLHSFVHTAEPIIKIARTGAKGKKIRTIKAEQAGEVVYIDSYSPKEGERKAGYVEVWVSTYHHAAVGDKVAGRYGNKSVIARIVPEEFMPYDPETGETLDICFNPLGLPSRMNLGQVLEVALGAKMAKEGKIAVITPFYPNTKEEVVNAYNEAGLAPKRLFLPEYGKYSERPVMTGVMFVLKLEQIANAKLSAVGFPQNVDPVFGQPVSSTDADKGQRVGEMEYWALVAAGATHIADDYFSWYADDVNLRRSYFSTLSGNKLEWDESIEADQVNRSPNRNSEVTEAVLRSFGLDLIVDEEDGKFHIIPIDMRDIPLEITASSFRNQNDGSGEHDWVKIALTHKVVHPFWVKHFPLGEVIGYYRPARIVNGQAYYDTITKQIVDERDIECGCIPEHYMTGMDALVSILEELNIDGVISRLSESVDACDYCDDDENYDIVAGIYDVSLYDEDSEDDGEDDVSSLPVDSGEDIDKDVDIEESVDNVVSVDKDSETADIKAIKVMRFLKYLRHRGYGLDCFVLSYFPILPKIFRPTSMVNKTEQEHSFNKLLRQIVEATTSNTIYQAIIEYVDGSKNNQNDWLSIRGYFFGLGPGNDSHGKFRENVLAKRIGFSGRCVIVPAQDKTMTPFFIGIPWRMALVECLEVIVIRLGFYKQADPASILRECDDSDFKKIVLSLYEYNSIIITPYANAVGKEPMEFYYEVRRMVREIIEGDVRDDGAVWYDGAYRFPDEEDVKITGEIFQTGRQPTLHKKSVRAFFTKLVDGDCIQIHPLVCSAFNADFDGDQMYANKLFGESKLEACRTISVLQDLISEKDGSFTLDLQQDAVLGLYCMTTYKDNAAEFNSDCWYYYTDAGQLRYDLEYGDLHFYDAVVYKDPHDTYYVSTAGRMLCNLYIPNALTTEKFQDKHGIAKKLGIPLDGVEVCELKYDDVFASTKNKPAGRPTSVIISDILTNTYKNCTERMTVMTAHKLFEIGVVASDIYSISMYLDDMSVDIKDEDGNSVSIEDYMTDPKHKVRQMISLYGMGLITEEERKKSTSQLWGSAKDKAQKDIVASMSPMSNMYYIMFSGARGNPSQLMQSVGFIGSISKTKTTDIEYPILRGYGQGLSSLDLMQACYSTRIGVVSAQSGTKDSGYATRQSVYMTSGLCIVEEDCGVHQHLMKLEYYTENIYIVRADGTEQSIESLIGEFVNDCDKFDSMRSALSRSNYIVNENVVETIKLLDVKYVVTMDDERIEIKSSVKMNESSRNRLLGSRSYALPFLTEDGDVTTETVDWVEGLGIKEVIAYDQWVDPFDNEAYLPVDYDASDYILSDETDLYNKVVSETSEGYNYYKNILSDGKLTSISLAYLTKKMLPSITFVDGSIVTIKYKISSLFRDLVTGREGRGLWYLDENDCITSKTLDVVEDFQLRYIPVRTTLTCLSEDGVCAHCYGRLSKGLPEVGRNVGISAVQSVCEPVTQTTLDVGHSGGNRASGTGLVSGLEYYMKLILGRIVPKSNQGALESFVNDNVPSGNYKHLYVMQDQFNPNSVTLSTENGLTVGSVLLADPERLNVPSGAMVDMNDTLISGLPVLDRYSNSLSPSAPEYTPKTVFEAALKTRYLLLKEYRKIFSGLSVLARNYEILSRAQTSQCYLDRDVDLPAVRDTSAECKKPTGNYVLRVSKQEETVSKFTGIASFGFQRINEALSSAILIPENLKMNSCLGNLVTGTRVGSHDIEFKPASRVGKRKDYSRMKQAFREKRPMIHINNTEPQAELPPNPLDIFGALGVGQSQTGLSNFDKPSEQPVYDGKEEVETNVQGTEKTASNSVSTLQLN